MKTISIFLALINSLMAGLLMMFTLSNGEIHQVESWWLLTKLLAGISVIVIGILTWIGSIGLIKPNLLVLASIYLVAIGASIVVWTFHLAQVTGDIEYYMVLYGGSLSVQGIALLFGILQGAGNVSAA